MNNNRISNNKKNLMINKFIENNHQYLWINYLDIMRLKIKNIEENLQY